MERLGFSSCTLHLHQVGHRVRLESRANHGWQKSSAIIMTQAARCTHTTQPNKHILGLQRNDRQYTRMVHRLAMERMQQSAQDAPAAAVMSDSPFLNIILPSHQLLIQKYNVEAPGI